MFGWVKRFRKGKVNYQPRGDALTVSTNFLLSRIFLVEWYFYWAFGGRLFRSLEKSKYFVFEYSTDDVGLRVKNRKVGLLLN